MAARTGQVSKCKLLLAACPTSLEVGDLEGRPALFPAAGRGHLAVVRLLHEDYGADLHTTDHKGLNALHYAAQSDEPQPVLLYLLSCGLNVNAGCHQGRTAIYFAAARGMVTAVQVLLQQGADVHCTVQADSGHNVLFAAALFGQTETMEVLLCSREGQRLLASRDSHSRTPLIATAGFGKALVRDVLALLLRHGADVHAVDTAGATALHLAAGNNNTGAVQLLLQHGATVDALHSSGVTPLVMAAAEGDVRCVQALLDAGADVSTTSATGWTVLHSAARNTAPEVLQLLLDHSSGAAAASIESLGSTRMCDASCCGRVTPLMSCRVPALVKLLLAAGASVHTATSTGNTALHVAAAHSYPTPVLCLLIKAGADLHAVNSAGDTAAQVAAKHGNTLAAALERAAVGP
jgi:ankyrin repeat protein